MPFFTTFSTYPDGELVECEDVVGISSQMFNEALSSAYAQYGNLVRAVQYITGNGDVDFLAEDDENICVLYQKGAESYVLALYL